MLVLVLGDLCVPLGSQDLPLKFKRLLVPGKISKILVTGNLTSPSVLDYLRTISQDISTVQGSLDAPCTQVPAERVVTLGNLRLGLIHGSAGLLPWGHPSALETKARQLDVDILLHGFGSGFEARETDGRFYVNPGSATGVYWHKVRVCTVYILHRPTF